MTVERLTKPNSALPILKLYKGMIAASTYELCSRLRPAKMHPPNYEMEDELYKFQQKIEAKYKES